MIKLDLHGMRHEEAKRKVDRLANTYCNWDENEEAEIITGHSSSMRNMVIEVLQEYDIEHYVGGYLGVDTTYIKIY